MLDEVSLVVVQFLVPVYLVLSKIDLIDSPEASHLIFVHFPNIVVLNWQNDESVWVFVK